MKIWIKRALMAAGAAAMMGAALQNPLSCDAPQGDGGNPYLREPDRICAPGTKLDEAKRQCVCE